MNTVRQLIRFATVGFLGNFALYVLYLLATSAGVGPKTAMTVLYILGVLITFAFNRTWSFGHAGAVPVALYRYLLVYLVGYITNLTALYLLVDRMGLAHQWVQGVMIVLIAAGLFLSQKYWIFTVETAP